jgi:hypothetical protein
MGITVYISLTIIQNNPARYRMNYVVKGQRTEGKYVLGFPMPGAVPSGSDLELPHLTPEYPKISRKLSLHAALAEVLGMIGADEAIDKIMREWDSIQVLSEDGGDARLLWHRLQLIAE